MFDLYVLDGKTNPNRAREVGHRVTLALISLVVATPAILDPTSSRAVLAWLAGPWGIALHYVLIAFAFGALLDVLANDWLKIGGPFVLLLEGRVNFYMLQAIVNIAIVGAMLKHDAWMWPATINAVIAFSSMWVAVMDTVWRYVQPRKRREDEFGLQAFEGAAACDVASRRDGRQHGDAGRHF